MSTEENPGKKADNRDQSTKSRVSEYKKQENKGLKSMMSEVRDRFAVRYTSSNAS